jgi:hypothetical protein
VAPVSFIYYVRATRWLLFVYTSLRGDGVVFVDVPWFTHGKGVNCGMERECAEIYARGAHMCYSQNAIVSVKVYAFGCVNFITRLIVPAFTPPPQPRR